MCEIMSVVNKSITSLTIYLLVFLRELGIEPLYISDLKNVKVTSTHTKLDITIKTCKILVSSPNLMGEILG